MRYAKDTVSQTQGIYSASNRSSFMRNPAVRAAMQFRSVPMMIYRLLARIHTTLSRARHGDSSGRSHIVGVHDGDYGGAGWRSAGVPEPIRLAVEMGHALGINDSWQEYQDKARSTLTNTWAGLAVAWLWTAC